MKKRFNLKNSIGRKNALLTIVALVLVMLSVVGVTYSWIEQISNVEMTYGGEESPMHISTNRLNKTAEAQINNGTEEIIDLSHYFYESGNMHLSSCYSDSKTFYFPNKKTTGTSTDTTYRLGTKDDANVNYISVTFQIKNENDYDEAFWFDNSTTFFSTGNDAHNKNIRAAFTVDSSTTIFSANNGATYKTINNYNTASEAVSSARSAMSFDAYKYDASNNDPTASGYSNANNSTTRGANGNVLFTLGANSTSEINIKVWLEYDGTPRDESLADIDLKLVSSYTKTRKIYFIDNSLYNTSATPSSPWVKHDDYNLYLAVLKYNRSSDRYEFIQSFTPTQTNNKFEFDVPSYYNGLPMIFLMSEEINGKSSSDYKDANYKHIDENSVKSDKDVYNGSTKVRAHHWWATTLPDNYEDSYFNEFTPAYGTWSDTVYHFYFIDSWGWEDNTTAYMWDNNTVSGNTQTTKNKAWPGEYLYHATGLTEGSVSSGNITIGNDTRKVYAAYFDTQYTHVIFSQNGSQQTSDLDIPDEVYTSNSNYYYDLNSNTWFTDTTKIPNKLSSVKLYGDLKTSGTWSADYTFYYNSNDNSVMYASVYIDHSCGFKIRDDYLGTTWWGHDGNGDSYSTTAEWTLKSPGNNLGINKSSDGIYWFRWKTEGNEGKLKVTFPYSASSSSSGSSSSSSSYYMWYNTNNSKDLNSATSAGAMTALGNGTYYSSFTCAGSNFDIIINNSSTKGSILKSNTTVTGFQDWAKTEPNGNVYWALDYYSTSGTTVYVIFNPSGNYSVNFTTTRPSG